ncbi:MAG: DUF2303 family protein [Corticimicrobacter sp.]|uniref:DUF2303 family protein n=1 Tax=Corticimicrobacter sp. TaxID=2678536 RepID=UPI0032DB5D72
MDQPDNIQTVLSAGAAAVQPIFSHGGIPYVAVPAGYAIKDLEKLLPAPARKHANVTTTDADSFILYTKKHGNLDHATIYADIDAEASRFNLVAVINDHGSDLNGQQWRDHRCLFAPTQSLEWKRWLSMNKKNFTQADFATWLEDNLPDIAAVPNMPTGADILQMSLAFEANADKRLRSKINLQSGGVQFEFVDDEDKDTRTKMQVFERFTLGLPVFDGSGSGYSLEARLKYRDRDGKVAFWYELIRPDRVFKTAVADELNRIKDATGFPVISGQP